jgi:hypothetical protein
MMELSKITAKALGLFDGAPDDSGVYVTLGASPDTTFYALRLNLNAGKFTARIHRVKNTLGKPVELLVGEVTESSIAALQAALPDLIDKAELPYLFGAHSITLHINALASYNAEESVASGLISALDRILQSVRSAGTMRFKSQGKLWDFTADTIKRAFTRNMGGAASSDQAETSFAVWFSFQDSGFNAVVKPQAGGFKVVIIDSAKPMMRKSTWVSSIDKVGQFVANHMCGEHIAVSSVKAAYAYTCQAA